MGTYLQGLLLGHILHSTRHRRVTVHWLVNTTSWALAVAAGIAVVFGLYPYANGHDIDLLLSAVYNSLSRLAWGLCVCWVIFSCVHGTEGGLVNSLLSLPVWVPLGRLTYAVYLVHPFVIIAICTQRRTPLWVDDINISVFFIAFLVLSYAAGFMSTLLFEAPFVALEKIIFKKEKVKSRI